MGQIAVTRPPRGGFGAVRAPVADAQRDPSLPPLVPWGRVAHAPHNQSLTDLAAQLEILQVVARGFTAGSSPAESRRLAASWLKQAAGTRDVGVRLYLPDRSGALRLGAFDGDPIANSRKGSARRRAAFRTGRLLREELPNQPGRSLVVLPLVHGVRSLGVVEVIGQTTELHRRWDTLHAVVCQVSAALHDLDAREEADQGSAPLQRSVRLVGQLLETNTASSAVRVAVAFLHEGFGLPVAGWAAAVGRPGGFALAAVKGMGSRQRAALRARMGQIPRTSTARASERGELAECFREVTGASEGLVMQAGRGILMTADLPPEGMGVVRAVAAVLAVVLQHLAKVDRAHQMSQQVDAGIAWTAHEFRGPVLGTKAALDFLLESKGDVAFDRDVLRRSSQQLQLLAEDVAALLQWASDARLSRSAVDLVEVVKQAIETTAFWHGEDRIVLDVKSAAWVKASSVHLRRAIANVAQNALQYSPEKSATFIEVSRQDDFAVVTISDLGPGIARAEQDEIFEPFVRGRAAKRGGEGRGLGLFVAKRVIEAHGGWIRVESSGRGATFRIGLPRLSGARARSGAV